ncbi:MAG: tyrosine-type recombinase/integrase [Sphaerochaeta sp.]
MSLQQKNPFVQFQHISCEQFLTEKMLNGYSEGTIETYHSILHSFQSFLGLQKHISQATSHHIRLFLTSLQNIKPRTMMLYRSTLNSYFTWLVETGSRKDNPVMKSGIKSRKIPRLLPRPLSDAEWGSIWQAVQNKRSQKNFWQYWALGFMRFGGLRISEVTLVNTDDISPASEDGAWEKDDKSLAWIRVLGKGDKERDALITNSSFAKDVLAYCKKYPKKVFVPRSISTIRKMCYAIGEKVKVDFHPHLLRHTYATELVDKEVPLEVVKLLLGHSRMDTTLIYAFVRPEKVLKYF